MGALGTPLEDALESFAEHSPLLIALDFDGTLAPLVDDPEDSRMIPEARAALEALTPLAGVVIALVSGRAIDSLLRVADPRDEWFMVGSHGIEFVPPHTAGSYLAPSIVPPALLEGFTQITQNHPGTRLEEKAFGLALHTRGVEAGLGARAQQAAQSLCEGWEGEIVVRRGHGILECSLIQASKGDGLQKLREVTGCQATLFAGDDATDEDALVLMRGDDVGIRVGGGDSTAAFHVAGCEDVASVLWHVYELLQVQSDSAASLPT